MSREAIRMPNSKGMTIRLPEDVIEDIRRARSAAEIKEKRTVSLNEIIIRALREYTATA